MEQHTTRWNNNLINLNQQEYDCASKQNTIISESNDYEEHYLKRMYDMNVQYNSSVT